MSTAIHDEIMRFILAKPEDAEMRERQRRMGRAYIKACLAMCPEGVGKVYADASIDVWLAGLREGHFFEARSNLRGIMARRQLALSAEEQARIDACDDISALERWIDQAIVAVTAAETLH